MRAFDFIFSDKPKHRWFRHVALWVVFCLYFFVVNFYPRTAADLLRAKTYLAAVERMIYIPISILAVYVTIYFLLPRYALKRMHVRFLALFIGLCGISVVNAFFLTELLAQLTGNEPFSKVPVQYRLFQPIAYGLGLSLSASGFAGVIKLLKIRYLRQKENERLQQQKIATEIQLIKTQFHPYFLSGALRQISWLLRHHCDQAPMAILKLADLLNYILYQNEQEIIYLEKERQLIEEYLALEKFLYGDRLNVHLHAPGNVGERKISPLIFLSLVQNCCGHFLAAGSRKLSIIISIKVENKLSIFSLSCRASYRNKASLPQQTVDLSPVERRLQVAYAGRYQLNTHSEQGNFSLQLKLEGDSAPQPSVTNVLKTARYEPA